METKRTKDKTEKKEIEAKYAQLEKELGEKHEVFSIMNGRVYYIEQTSEQFQYGRPYMNIETAQYVIKIDQIRTAIKNYLSQNRCIIMFSPYLYLLCCDKIKQAALAKLSQNSISPASSSDAPPGAGPAGETSAGGEKQKEDAKDAKEEQSPCKKPLEEELTEEQRVANKKAKAQSKNFDFHFYFL